MVNRNKLSKGESGSLGGAWLGGGAEHEKKERIRTPLGIRTGFPVAL